jgi:hypothetical protein
MEREMVVVKNEVARTNRRSDASLLALARLRDPSFAALVPSFAANLTSHCYKTNNLSRMKVDLRDDMSCDEQYFS